MKKWIMMGIIFSFSLVACTSTGGITFSPSKIDWKVTRDYYKDYVQGVVVPVGVGVTAMACPDCMDKVILAKKEVDNLGTLIDQNASNATISEKVQTVQKAIQDVNEAIGSNK